MTPRFFTLLLAITFFVLLGCRQNPTANADLVYPVQLADLRLGDGVPITLVIYVRWRIDDPEQFHRRFPDPETFNKMVLYPAGMEIGNTLANSFPSVDSVFSTQRERFLTAMKNALQNGLAEEGMSVQEVTVSNILFPESYTQAMEKVGLQLQLLEAIRQEKDLAVVRATAEREKTVAQAQVEIAQAEADARVAQINARTEESQRQRELAKAETEALVSRKQAQAEADRNRLLTAAELEKKEQLDNLEIQKGKKTRRAELDDQIELATVVQDNPVFASFLINRELASKVEIAVLPTGTDPSVFGGLLKQGMNGAKN